jgi:Zn-dependent M16 (insulinase) family peptidase
VPTQVNYVAKGVDLFKHGYTLHGSTYVVNKLLGTGWLWDRVRVVGGAYGGFADFDPHSGAFTFASYRDPNLLKTLDAFDGSQAFLRSLATSLDGDALTKAIIGTIGDVDAYQLPDAKGYSALMRHLLGVSDEERALRREQILGTKPADFGAFADVLEAARGADARIVAVCSPDAAAAAAAERPALAFKTVSVL